VFSQEKWRLMFAQQWGFNQRFFFRSEQRKSWDLCVVFSGELDDPSSDFFKENLAMFEEIQCGAPVNDS
jgi:hypothetical protein